MICNKKAFTLIELMLVIIIIGILSAMIVPNISGRSRQARITTAKVDIQANITMALDLYEMDNGVYPSTEQGLLALVQEPVLEPFAVCWNGPYLKIKRMPKDPWGKEYAYLSPGEHNIQSFDLVSYGPDGIKSPDDIVNW